MKYTPENYDILVSALKDTQKHILSLDPIPDKGTCNMDANVIDFTGWPIAKVRKLQLDSGVYFSDKLTSRWWKGSRFINFRGVHGMANRRNFIVESADKHLKMSGAECCIYYQMD